MFDASMPTSMPASTFDTSAIIYFFDMTGVIACSVSGTILAQSKRFDLMGCILVAMVTAIGGGTVRDLMLDRHPLFWMTDLSYLVVITATSIACQIFLSPKKFAQPAFNGSRWSNMQYWLKFSDAIGMSAFTLIGVKVALSFGSNLPVAMLMGIVTILVGGMLRDMICNEIPLVLQKEIYITASMAGSLLYFLMQRVGVIEWLAQVVMMTTIFSIRMLALRFDWHIPPLNSWFEHR